MHAVVAVEVAAAVATIKAAAIEVAAATAEAVAATTAAAIVEAGGAAAVVVRMLRFLSDAQCRADSSHLPDSSYIWCFTEAIFPK